MDVDSEKQLILKSPHEYICNYIEEIYPNVGKKVFDLLSIVPCSLILPPFITNSREVKSNISILLLAPSGTAKSSICREFTKVSYSPIEGRSFTPAALEDIIFEQKTLSLIIEDFSVLSSDEQIVKIIEGAIGEEGIIHRHTKRKIIEEKVNVIGLLCGVPGDLSGRISSGISGRTVWIGIVLNEQEHSNIGKHISASIGKESNTYAKEQIVKNYYHLLHLIQLEQYDEDYYELIEFFNLEKKKYPKVKSYDISETTRSNLYNLWDNDTKKYKPSTGSNWFREQYDGFRFLIAHSFLNYFNRQINSGRLITNNQDLIYASQMLKQTMRTKYDLLFICENMSRVIRTQKEFEYVMQSHKISPLAKGVLQQFAKVKKII